MRAIGFVALAAALLSIPALLSGSSVLATKRKARALFDRTAYKDRLFLIFTCCSFSTFLGYIVPYFYIPTYATNRLGLSQSMGLYMLVMSIAASFFGRLVSGALAQWLGPIVTWALCTFASAILSLCWISIEKEANFIAFSILWGGSLIHALKDINHMETGLLMFYRLLLRCSGHTTVRSVRKYYSRSFTVRHTTWNELECLQRGYAHRRADCWCTAEDERRWKVELYWGSDMEWSVFNGRNGVLVRAVVCNDEIAK